MHRQLEGTVEVDEHYHIAGMKGQAKQGGKNTWDGGRIIAVKSVSSLGVVTTKTGLRSSRGSAAKVTSWKSHLQGVQVSDDALKSRVEQALRADPARQDSQIAVPSVHQGVRRVAGEVHSPHTLADAEIWREPTPHQPRETYGVREAASDRRITPETKMRLLADSQTPALAINVDTRSGVVTLFGIVPSQKAKGAVAADGRARHLGRAGGQG